MLAELAFESRDMRKEEEMLMSDTKTLGVPRKSGGTLMPCRECQHETSTKAISCPNCGALCPTVDDRPNAWGFEYKSKAKVLGMPLVHISFKFGRNRLPVPARGFIAIGQFAFGVITISQVGVGLLSISQFALAGFAVAQFGAAYSLIAQIGIYVSSGYGQSVRSLAEMLQ